uniref:Secreted protein n=1 Tax=Amaranthus palmeri TaxID=107608 RepID=A0A6C0T734_AMAPA|nr:hypothetical protein AP_R.00g000146-v1.0.a3 [Amaranthus palmeri]
MTTPFPYPFFCSIFILDLTISLFHTDIRGNCLGDQFTAATTKFNKNSSETTASLVCSSILFTRLAFEGLPYVNPNWALHF